MEDSPHTNFVVLTFENGVETQRNIPDKAHAPQPSPRKPLHASTNTSGANVSELALVPSTFIGVT